MAVTLNPRHFHLRVDPDGQFWMTHEKYRHPVTRVKNVTSDVLLALCADLSADNATEAVIREVKFSDGWKAKVTVEMVKDEQ